MHKLVAWRHLLTFFHQLDPKHKVGVLLLQAAVFIAIECPALVSFYEKQGNNLFY